MADLTITQNQVKWVGGVRWLIGTAGTTITRGQALTLVDNEYLHGDANFADNSVFAGIALTDGYDGGLVVVAPPGAIIDFGATLVAGQTYIMSINSGAIADDEDAGAGWYVTVIAVGQGTREAEILTNPPGLRA